jgi:hypothetical protein
MSDGLAFVLILLGGEGEAYGSGRVQFSEGSRCCVEATATQGERDIV